MCCYWATPFRTFKSWFKNIPIPAGPKSIKLFRQSKKAYMNSFNFLHNHNEVPPPQRSATKWVSSSAGKRGWGRLECCGFLTNFFPLPHEGKPIVFRERHVVFFHGMEGGVPSRLTGLAVWGPHGNDSRGFANGLNEIRHAWSGHHTQLFIQNTVSGHQVNHPLLKKSHLPQEIILSP